MEAAGPVANNIAEQKRAAMHFEEDEFDEDDVPGWFEDIMRRCGEAHSDEAELEAVTFKHWVSICRLPKPLRDGTILAFTSQAADHLYSEASERHTQLQEDKRESEQLIQLIKRTKAGGVTPNEKKKRTIDAKLDDAYGAAKEALEGLTQLQKKRVLKRLSKKYN